MVAAGFVLVTGGFLAGLNLEDSASAPTTQAPSATAFEDGLPFAATAAPTTAVATTAAPPTTAAPTTAPTVTATTAAPPAPRSPTTVVPAATAAPVVVATEAPPSPVSGATTPPPSGFVTAGAFCTPAGATGSTSAGTPMTCSTATCTGEPYDQPRWRRSVC